MRKILYALILLLCLSLVSAATTGSLLPVTVGYTNGNTGAPGDSVEVKLTVQSTEDIASVLLTSTDLVLTGDATKKITAPSISSVSTLVADTAQEVKFSVTIPSTLSGTYTGTITAEDASNQDNKVTADYSIVVTSVNKFSVTEDKLKLAGQEEKSDSGVINFVNTGSTSLTFTSADLSYDNTKFTKNDLSIGLTFSDVTVAPGETKTMTIEATIPNKMDLDTYSGLVTITKGTLNETFTLEVRVQPKICKDGEIGSDLDLSVDNPDDNDDFAPGDTISIETNVANDGTDDKDVVVEAELWDLDSGDKISDIESDYVSVNEDEDEDIDLSLEIPTDSDIDEDHEFVLYIKAYEKGDEDKECVEEAIDINIEREDHAMIFSQFEMNPSIATCGGMIDATVKVENIGSKDEDDVTIRLLNNELGLDLTSNPFDVDRASKKNNDYTARFEFNIPSGANEKDYSVEAVVTFDDGDEKKSEFATLNIKECAPVPGSATDVVLEVSDIGGEIKKDKTISIPVKLTSNELGSQPYSISLDNVGAWAEPVVAQTLTLNKDQFETVYFYLKPQSDLDEGIYTAVVNVKSGNNVIATKTLSFEVAKQPSVFSGVTNWFEGTNIFWIIGDIVLVIVAIFFIKLIFSGRKGPKEVKL